jgi:UDP-N-acetylglucosamine 2-epimerase (non-hydrolysing)
MPIKVLFIFGTRPEAIKLCPVIRHMKSRPDDFDARVCVTAQHREMLDQVLNVFDVTPDRDLDIMRPGQTLCQSTSCIVAALEPVLAKEKPSIVLVQGDTTTTFSGALAAFYAKIPVGHVEAGLRTGDLHQPFPEEMNRLLTGRLASLHFAPTEGAARNLYREGVDHAAVAITGNTGIDAVLHVTQALEAGKLIGLKGFPTDSSKKLIVVTAHRRETFGDGLDRICAALTQLSRRYDVEIVYPVHPNPNVRQTVNRHLAGQPNIRLLDPMDYVPFVDLMRRAYLLLTDSGGIQEEAPSLGKPVLVLRGKTERPEAVSAGTARLVGTDERQIVAETERLLDDPAAYYCMARRHNPYGDGRASERIAKALASAEPDQRLIRPYSEPLGSQEDTAQLLR